MRMTFQYKHMHVLNYYEHCEKISNENNSFFTKLFVGTAEHQALKGSVFVVSRFLDCAKSARLRSRVVLSYSQTLTLK